MTHSVWCNCVTIRWKARLRLPSSKLHVFALAGGAGRSELFTGNMMILAGFKSLQAEFLQHTKAWKRSNVAANVKCNQSAVWWVKTCRESVVADRCTCPRDAVGHQCMRRSYHCSGCMMPSLSRQTALAIFDFFLMFSNRNTVRFSRSWSFSFAQFPQMNTKISTWRHFTWKGRDPWK